MLFVRSLLALPRHKVRDDQLPICLQPKKFSESAELFKDEKGISSAINAARVVYLTVYDISNFPEDHVNRMVNSWSTDMIKKISIVLKYCKTHNHN